jgi:hypothetical protein
LRQHKRAQDIGVDAIGKRDIDEAILAANWHRGLRTLLRERKETIAGAAAENNCQ